MTQIRTGVEKVSFGPFGAPFDPSGPNFHMREWWPMVLDHNRNPFRSFAVELNDLNWIRGPKNPKKSFLVVLGCPIGDVMVDQWLTTRVQCYYVIIEIVFDHLQSN